FLSHALLCLICRPPRPPLFPYTTLFRSTFITLRRRSPKLLAEVAHLPPSAWRTVELDLPHRKYRNPQFYEQKARPLQRAYRQFRSEEHTSELQSHLNLVCRLLLEKKKLK